VKKERLSGPTNNSVITIKLTGAVLFAAAWVSLAATPDRRNISTGSMIPDEGYSDQPYIVKTNDRAWLCVITTGPGIEGQRGQHVVARRSTDLGKTWSAPVDIEPSNGPESSYAVLLKTEAGRVYVFYNHNTDNVRQVIADKPAYPSGFCSRVDSLGHFVFKYSDDNGLTWSAKRYDVPMRDFEIDRRNPYAGKLKFFWNVGRAFTHAGAGYVPLHKVGGFGEGFFTSSEGVLLRSANILTERDPEKLRWETLPDGDIGLRAPPGGGPIAEEQSFTVMSDGSLFAVYRTIDGYSACTYSRDSGHTWETPRYMRYADGRLMKHPRAANFAWRCENGKYLYWFHNHGGRFIRENSKRRTIAYEDRNPVWLSGGVEADSPSGKIILWSQPEIALYDDDPFIRMSYPDLVEGAGKYFLTETQKEVARVHEIDPTLLAGLWGQLDRDPKPLGDGQPLPNFVQRSRRADYGTDDLRAGFSVELRLQLKSLAPGQILADNRLPDGRGFAIQTVAGGGVEIVLDDGRTENRWASDPGSIEAGKPHHVVATVDGGPKIITFVIDGKLCDGGDARQFGWGRFNPNFRSPNGGGPPRIGVGLEGQVLSVSLYGRGLRTSEAVRLFRGSK
jgi:hypothetical protein